MHKRCVNSKECGRVEKFWSDLWATDVRTPQFEHVGAHSSQPLDSGIFQIIRILGHAPKNLFNVFATTTFEKKMQSRMTEHALVKQSKQSRHTVYSGQTLHD